MCSSARPAGHSSLITPRQVTESCKKGAAGMGHQQLTQLDRFRHASFTKRYCRQLTDLMVLHFSTELRADLLFHSTLLVPASQPAPPPDHEFFVSRRCPPLLLLPSHSPSLSPSPPPPPPLPVKTPQNHPHRTIHQNHFRNTPWR